ncbi:MAG: NAD-dependent epimerase/dehydratase family protein [Myxococcales bacterium]|nr:NAD-dependent epimerase/dehydratase family protein [Myxococcales bacterium]
MSNDRRDLSRRDVVRGALAATALGLGAAACSSSKKEPAVAVAVTTPPPPPVRKKILILGGTGFLGPKTVEAALARGHEVTIFNRGKREKLLPLGFEVEHLYGNRDPELPADDERGPDGALLHPDASPKGLEQLAGRSWDVVIDNSGYVPRLVGASAQLLAPRCQQYIYISSISAYDEIPARGGDETARLATIADPTVESMGAEFENYGALKALSERAAEAAFPGRATIVRPGYIVGPGDPSDRFTYWPVRVAAGGEVLAPGSPDDPLQWIDVRDLAAWLVTLAEHGTAGIFNAVGPAAPARWGDVLDACVAGGGGDARLTWVPSAWLAAHEMGGEDAFPIWTAPVGKFAGFHRWRPDRAIAAGLTFRPMADTVAGLLAWYPTELERRVRVTAELRAAAEAKGAPTPKGPDPAALRAGPPRAREAELLAQFHASASK